MILNPKSSKKVLLLFYKVTEIESICRCSIDPRRAILSSVMTFYEFLENPENFLRLSMILSFTTHRWTVYASECVPMHVCGTGVQEQKVECLQEYKEKTHAPKVVPHKECHNAKVGRKPLREVPCYTPCSTVRWMYSAWSKVINYPIVDHFLRFMSLKNQLCSVIISCLATSRLVYPSLTGIVNFAQSKIGHI